MKAMNTNFKKFEAGVSIIKTVNNLLMKKPVEVERQCWKDAHFSRKECLEIAGIPTSITQQNFEERVCQIFKATGVSFDKNYIDDYHRL